MPKIRTNTWDGRIMESVLIRNEYGLPNDMRGWTVLDIGAHIGSFALACQKRNAKTVHCYEPDPDNFAMLVQNTTDDVESRTQIVIINSAVTGETCGDLGIRRLGNHDADLGTNTGHVDVFGESDGTEGAGINAVMASMKEPIDFLKMDCEGAEWGIFEAMDLSKVRRIAAELHAVPEGSHRLLSNLKGASLNDLAFWLTSLLKINGFETSMVYDSTETAQLRATKVAETTVAENRKPIVLWIGDAAVTTGFSKVTDNICRRLVTLGWDVRVLGIGYNGDPHTRPYSIYPAVDPNTGGNRMGLTRLKEIIDHVKPDVVAIQDDYWNVGLTVDHMAMLGAWVPAVGYLAIDSENIRQDSAFQLRNLKHAICHTGYGVTQLTKAGYTGPISIAQHGVDKTLYKPYDKAESRDGIKLPGGGNVNDAFIWGVVGANQPRKRMDLSVAYFHAWWHAAGRPKNAYLYIHTNYDGSWDLRQLTEYLGLKGHVLGSEGILPESHMPSMYSALDAMISTAECESFGLTHLEGAACGIPQIAVNTGGMPSWAGKAFCWVYPSVVHYLEGRINAKRWVAAEGDFVKAMMDMYTKADMRESFSRAGLELAQTLDWDDTAKHFDNVLRGILAVKAKAAKAGSALADF